MSYRTLKSFLAALFVSAALISGCDVIENPIQDADIQEPDTATFKQNVLIEDFTGHTCGNCPEAAEKADSIIKRFGSDRVFVIGVHAGPFAFVLPPDYPTDWTCPESKELDNTFKVSRAGNPNGFVNRTEKSGKFILGDDDWAPAAVVELAKEPRLGISAESSWNASTKTVTVDVDLTFLEEGSTDYHLAAYIIENGLIGDQKDLRVKPSHITDFKFEHVLRGSVTGTWGEPLSAEPISKGTKLEKQLTYTFPANKDWVPENCDIVVFVHQHQTTKEIVNVTKVHVTGK